MLDSTEDQTLPPSTDGIPPPAEEPWDNIEGATRTEAQLEREEAEAQPAAVPHPGDHAYVPDAVESDMCGVCGWSGPAPDSAEHPANPATYPIPPKQKLTEFVELTEHELAEKGKALAREYMDVEALKAKRSSLNAQIKAKEETIGALVIAITSGQVEVPVEQQDLLRQPVGPIAAAEAFDAMAKEAAQDGEADPLGLNAMAEGIQAEQGITEPGEAFQNDIENFKAKSAAKRKGKA